MSGVAHQASWAGCEAALRLVQERQTAPTTPWMQVSTARLPCLLRSYDSSASRNDNGPTYRMYTFYMYLSGVCAMRPWAGPCLLGGM